MDQLPLQNPLIGVRKIVPRTKGMDVAIERKGVTRRVPALVVVFPPMLNAQLFQHYLIKTAPRIFVASAGVSPSGKRYAHEPTASYYLREAFHRAMTDVTAAQLPRAISILPILVAGCAARTEQLVARNKTTRDNLGPIHARAFDMMMKVDTEALHARLRDAEDEQIDADTNWNYDDHEELPAVDERRRRGQQRQYTERENFIKMARTLLGEDVRAVNSAKDRGSTMVAMGEHCHDRAWAEREMFDASDEAARDSLPAARVEVLVGSSDIDARILNEFDMTFDADGESQILCAYDSMLQVEAASAASILDPAETVYLLVSVAPHFYQTELERVLRQFMDALPQDVHRNVFTSMSTAFCMVTERVVRMMARHSDYVQSFIEDPEGRRIVVFNTAEHTQFIDNVGVPAYDPTGRYKSVPDRQLERYYPLMMNACSEQLLEALNSDTSALSKINISHVFVNEDTMTRVQVARMGGVLTTLISATYAPRSEMQTLDPSVLILLRTAEGDTGRAPVAVTMASTFGGSRAASAAACVKSDDYDEFSESECAGGHIGQLLLVESRSSSPPPFGGSRAASAAACVKSDDYDYDEFSESECAGGHIGRLLLVESRSSSPPLNENGTDLPPLNLRAMSPPISIRQQSTHSLPSSDSQYTLMPTGSQ